jgi:hypothetical protein
MRTIVKWYISRSLDRGVRLPRWVRARIDCDLKLRRFESLARQLDDRLRRDAPEWIAIEAKESRDDVRVTRPLVSSQSYPLHGRRWAAAAGALAAGVAVVLANLPSGGDQVDRPIRSGDGQRAVTAHAGTNSALDRQWLIAAWNSGRASIHQIRVRSIGLRDRVTVPKMPDFSTILEPTEIAGSIAGRTAATLDSGIQLQLRQVSSDLRTAVSFFAHRLPASAAKLAGLRSQQGT